MPNDSVEAKLKYLEFIQGAISRVSDHSFKIKGWAVTVVAALLALTTNKVANPGGALLAVPPALLFWIMDTHYLHQERRFRRLYERAVVDEVDLFCMNPLKVEQPKADWWRCLFSKTVLPLYATLIAVAFVVAYYYPDTSP